jgi:hypothetical protein
MLLLSCVFSGIIGLQEERLIYEAFGVKPEAIPWPIEHLHDTLLTIAEDLP